MDDVCKTVKAAVEIQENGIVRNLKGEIIGHVDYEKVKLENDVEGLIEQELNKCVDATGKAPMLLILGVKLWRELREKKTTKGEPIINYDDGVCKYGYIEIAVRCENKPTDFIMVVT